MSLSLVYVQEMALRKRQRMSKGKQAQAPPPVEQAFNEQFFTFANEAWSQRRQGNPFVVEMEVPPEVELHFQFVPLYEAKGWDWMLTRLPPYYSKQCVRDFYANLKNKNLRDYPEGEFPTLRSWVRGRHILLDRAWFEEKDIVATHTIRPCSRKGVGTETYEIPPGGQVYDAVMACRELGFHCMWTNAKDYEYRVTYSPARIKALLRLMRTNMDPKTRDHDELNTAELYHAWALRIHPDRECNLPAHILRTIVRVASSTKGTSPFVFPRFLTWVIESAGVRIPEDERTHVTDRERLTPQFLFSIHLRFMDGQWYPQDRYADGHFLAALVDPECDYDVGFDIPEVVPPAPREELLRAGRPRLNPEGDREVQEEEAAEYGGEHVRDFTRRQVAGREQTTGRDHARGRQRSGVSGEDIGVIKGMLVQLGHFMVKLKDTLSCVTKHMDDIEERNQQRQIRLHDPHYNIEELARPLPRFQFPTNWPELDLGGIPPETYYEEEQAGPSTAGPAAPGEEDLDEEDAD